MLLFNNTLSELTDSTKTQPTRETSRAPSTQTQIWNTPSRDQAIAEYDFNSSCQVQPRQGFKISWTSDKKIVVKPDNPKRAALDKYEPRINFRKAANAAKNSHNENATSQSGRSKSIKNNPHQTIENSAPSNNKLSEQNTYLHKNKVLDDLPSFTPDGVICTITVRAHGVKQKIRMQRDWSGEDTYKFLSHSLRIPLENLKLIHKCKVMPSDSF